ncbi:hypothetical protein HOT31_gp039 [Microbacterium phage Hendrix]|uniref:Uncharacterized protein n=1 Tax=Microbacterium phage Hendrix TaxID=2182341 RepID=A0A2U8UU70_9CAUD|nr:hypothetical protein HOT31_gp039 [Microbacterium phage Hendrix]AWN07710.1 hypothetical protein PBI_HENDRIX_39 [Microbacterium phage Hendrix]
MRRMRRALVILCWLSPTGHRWTQIAENFRGFTHLTTTWRCSRCRKRVTMLVGLRPDA